MKVFDSRMDHSLPPFKVEYRNDHAIEQLSQHLAQRFRMNPYDQDIVILCIGTDRSTGDALGPLVGTKLKSLYPQYLNVYGTLEDPVHAMNLADKIESILQAHRTPTIVAIDACLGQFSNVGNINVADGPLKPGAGVKKDLPSVGTFHITGIVNVGGFMEYFVLQNTRLYIVMKMAEIISSALFTAALQLSGENSKLGSLSTDRS